MFILRQGSIIWAWVVDRRGRNGKHRGGVIITESDEISTSEEVAIVAIASQPDDKDAGASIELPWHRDKRYSKTGLVKRCYAICNWIHTTRVDSIEDVGGYVPDNILKQILENVPSQFRS